jgi:hypothetical protein
VGADGRRVLVLLAAGPFRTAVDAGVGVMAHLGRGLVGRVLRRGRVRRARGNGRVCLRGTVSTFLRQRKGPGTTNSAAASLRRLGSGRCTVDAGRNLENCSIGLTTA